jgi:hypothetical protein
VGIAGPRILLILPILLPRRSWPRSHSIRAAMLASILVHNLQGPWCRVSGPQSNACVQQSIVLVACEVEERPRVSRSGSVSEPQGRARTGLSINVARVPTAPPAYHGRRIIRHCARYLVMGQYFSGRVSHDPHGCNDLVTDALRAGTILVSCRRFDAGRRARRLWPHWTDSTHVGSEYGEQRMTRILQEVAHPKVRAAALWAAVKRSESANPVK